MKKSFLGTISGKINTNSFSFTAEKDVNKFDYIKTYHENNGFILSQIIKLVNKKDNIHAKAKIIGYRDSRNLLKKPKTPHKQKTEVYLANSNFIKKILGINNDGAYVGILENYHMIKVNMDIKKLITKHLAVLAKTGAGKSYTVGVIIEELMEKGVPCLVIDPHGEYTSFKKENTDYKDKELMNKYDVKPKKYDNVTEYSPNTALNKNATDFSISFSSLQAHNIANLTPIKLSGSKMGILYNIISKFRKEDNYDYDLDDIRKELENMNTSSKYTVFACLDYLENINVFSHNPTRTKDLVKPGKTTLINMRGVNPQIQRIITAKICNDLFNLRKKDKIPPFFLIIEEAHNFCPERSFGESPSSQIIRNIASEGRKFGMGLGIISQRPARVDKSVLSQCNTQIIQKITNPNDLKAVSNSSENITSEVVDEISSLPVGFAMITGVSAQPLFVDVRVRRTEHGGKSVDIISETSTKRISFVKSPKIVHNNFLPCYLSSVKKNNNQFELLLRGDSEGIIRFGKSRTDFVNPLKYLNKLSNEEKQVLKYIISKERIPEKYNEYVKSLIRKKVINKKGEFTEEFIINNDYSGLKFNKKIMNKELSEKRLPSFNISEKNVKDYLKNIGFETINIKPLYLKI